MEDSEKLEKAEVEPTEEKPQETQPTEEIIETPEEPFDKERAMATIKKLRQFEKDAAKLQKELDAIKEKEEAKKREEMSEIERLRLEKQEADQQLRELRLKEQRREIAEKVKLPFALADRIKGETPEEMEADAVKLFESLPKPTPKTGITNPGAQATETPPSRPNADIDPFNPEWVKSHGGGAFGA